MIVLIKQKGFIIALFGFIGGLKALSTLENQSWGHSVARKITDPLHVKDY